MLSTTAELLTNEPFMGRVAAAVLKSAGDIREAPESYPANHLTWANSILNYGDARLVAGWFAPLFVASDGDLVFAYENDPSSTPTQKQAAIGDQSIINGVNAQVGNDADTRFPTVSP